VEISHNGFCTRAQVWMRIRNGAGVGNQPQIYKGNITIPHTSRRISSSILEKHNSTPRIGDIWIPRLFVSPNHFVRLYIHGVEDLFQNGDHVIKVDHMGSRFRIMSWRIWQDTEQRL
jgi:hypothetical protein